MKIDKKKIIILLIIIWIITFLATIVKIIVPSSLKCHSLKEEEIFSNRITVTVNYKKNNVINIKYKEVFTTNKKNLLKLQKEDYKNKKYKIKSKNTKITATLTRKEASKFKEVIKKLEEAGYTCK